MTSQAIRLYLVHKRAAVLWVEATIGETLQKEEDFFAQLLDGVVLCKVMQRISPSMIPRIKVPVLKRRASNHLFKTNENVSFFLQACIEIGVPRHRRFVLHDLVNTQKTFPLGSARRIIDCLQTLCEVANKHSKLYDFNIKWPVLDPEKEKFSKEEIKEAEKMFELYNKAEQQKVEGIKPNPDGTIHRPMRVSKMDQQISQQRDKENKAATKLQALVKGWIARNRFRSMVRHQAYRDRVAHEILSTERVYVEHLEFLFKYVLQPLRLALENNNPILPENEIRAIFSETEVILNYNRLLLVQLEQRVGKWNVHQCLGDIFLQIAGFLKIYSQYCSHYSEAMRILGECKKLSKFKKFLDDLKKKSHDLEHRGLEDFLIRPVQRIPRYFLLLQDLVRHTSADHPDYANLSFAVQKVQAVAEYMNEKKREAENIMKVTEIQEMIEGECEPLALPHRRFVREAQMQEVTSGTARKHAVVVFLFNDLLLVTRTQGSSFLSRNKIPKLVFAASYKLAGSQVMSLEDTPGFPNAFVFTRIVSKRTITLLASSKELKDEWVTSIEAEIAGATQQENEQDKRITNTVTDKVADAKLELEKRMSHVLDSHKSLTASSGDELSNALLALSSLSSTSSTSIGSCGSGEGGGEEAAGGRKSMSLRDKRIQLMNQAKKNPSGSTLTVSVAEK